MRVEIRSLLWLTAFAVACFFGTLCLSAQSTSCPAATSRTATPADEAYAQGKYDTAESLYMQAISQHPHDPTVVAALVRTLLHEGKVADAAAQANKILADDPHSVPGLTALAEMQYRKGMPWQAMETLDTVIKTDPCYARAHLLRSQVLRIDSMYSSERKELQAAYDLDPADPDIRRAWLEVDSPARDIENIQKELATMKDVDADLREKAMASAQAMMGQLSENSQTCKTSPITSSVTLPLIPVLQDAKHINGYHLEVQFPQGKARLAVDTAASGLYISRALAEANGLQQRAGDPPDTVRVDSVHVGRLEFRDCMVGVSDAQFPDKSDGFIGSDIFAPYLITLNYPAAKLELEPLPALPTQGSLLPEDRYIAPGMQGFSPVYHRLQYLLVPVTLNKREQRLFVLDSGMRLSTMTSEVAHSVSTTKINFTNPMQTVSGGTVQIFRDSFDYQFADFSVNNFGHVLEFNPSAIDENARFQVAGMLGLDMLHSLVLHLDYRDGLAKFDAAGSGPAPQGALIASAGTAAQPLQHAECDRYVDQAGDLPTNVTIEAQIVGWLDSTHAKPGQPVTLKVVHEWIGEDCRLPAGAAIYGNVLASSSGKNGAQLAVAFDRGDCFRQIGKALSLRLIGVVGPPGERKAMHDSMPTEVHGARAISDTAADMGLQEDENLNPGGPPHTVHPGIVVGLKGLTMTPEAGPQCSALMTSAKNSVRLDTGSEFILTMEKSTP